MDTLTQGRPAAMLLGHWITCARRTTCRRIANRMAYKTLSPTDAARLAARPSDYHWDNWTGNGFIAACMDARWVRLSDALELLDIHGAADVALGSLEWCLARVQAHVDPTDGHLRLQAAWAATVDPRHANFSSEDAPGSDVHDEWTMPDQLAREFVKDVAEYLAEGWTSKVRQVALGSVLMADHLCGRDAAFAPWLHEWLRAKVASSPRHADDHDYTARDTAPPRPGQLASPTRSERLANLDPATNPYLRTAEDVDLPMSSGDPCPTPA